MSAYNVDMWGISWPELPGSILCSVCGQPSPPEWGECNHEPLTWDTIVEAKNGYNPTGHGEGPKELYALKGSFLGNITPRREEIPAPEYDKFRVRSPDGTRVHRKRKQRERQGAQEAEPKDPNE